MISYYKEATTNTPFISFNAQKGVLIIDGNCSLVEPALFFEELTQWIEKYSANPNEKTILTINVTAINISTSKFLLNIIYQIEKLFNNGNEVKVRWVYNNDEDGTYELGSDYAEMVKVPFVFIETTHNIMCSID